MSTSSLRVINTPAPSAGDMEEALHLAERSLVSGALRGDPECLEAVLGLDPEALLNPTHRTAVGLMHEVVSEGEVVSLETVLALLVRTSRLGILSASVLAELTDATSSLDPSARAEEITTAWTHRRMARDLSHLSSIATTMSAEDLRNRIGELLQGLPDNTNRQALPAIAIPDDWASELLPHRAFALGVAAPLGGVTLLSGQGGSGKSTLALQGSMGLACGRELVPGWKPSEPGRVLFVALEDEILEIRRRMGRIAFAFDLTEREAALVVQNLTIVPLSRPDFFRLGSGRGIELGPHFSALARMLAVGSYRLCVLDPVAALLAGSVEENSNPAAQFVIGRLASLLPSTTALLLAAHVSKTDRDLASSPRGAGAWSDAARQAWGMRPATPKESDSLPFGVDQRQVVVLHSTKSNYSALAPQSFLVKLQDPRCAGVLQFLDVAGAVATRAKSDASRLDEALLTVLSEHDCSRSELAGAVAGTGYEKGRIVRGLVAELVGAKVTVAGIREAADRLMGEGRLISVASEGLRKRLVPNNKGVN